MVWLKEQANVALHAQDIDETLSAFEQANVALHAQDIDETLSAFDDGKASAGQGARV
jgi:hypothetical protein